MRKIFLNLIICKINLVSMNNFIYLFVFTENCYFVIITPKIPSAKSNFRISIQLLSLLPKI